MFCNSNSIDGATGTNGCGTCSVGLTCILWAGVQDYRLNRRSQLLAGPWEMVMLMCVAGGCSAGRFVGWRCWSCCGVVLLPL